MKLLGHAYRFLSNFLFLALVYYSLNFMEKYQQRAVLAILVLIYAGMRAATTLRSFYFFQRIERLEFEARRHRRGGPRHVVAAQADRRRSRRVAPWRRDQRVYRPVVSRDGRVAVRFQDRGELNRRVTRFFS